MPSTRAAKPRPRPARSRRRRSGFLRRLRPWRDGWRWVWRKLKAAPRGVQFGIFVAVALVAFAAANLVYQVARKPTEMFVPIAHSFDKSPAETWWHYGALFREYSTAAITPELLAALAQAEGAGNPVAHTYWRWSLTWHPLGIYRPASSAVGMFQMTEAAFADARHGCIRAHKVTQEGCAMDGLYTRILPEHAVELTAIFLDRNVSTILARLPRVAASQQQKEDLATIVHLCGAGPATGFARRGFRLSSDEACGDHETAVYLAKVNALKRQFLRLANDR